jgi:hypothetical protein
MQADGIDMAGINFVSDIRGGNQSSAVQSPAQFSAPDSGNLIMWRTSIAPTNAFRTVRRGSASLVGYVLALRRQTN